MTMPDKPTQNELDESINALRSYRDRLKKELISISQKLHMPKNKIDIALKDNTELQNVENALSGLLNKSQKA